jgi:uncharacterized Zn finger protein/DNA-binding transcriptional regulator YiaG
MKELARRQKKGLALQPVLIDGRKIASTFWGQSWCKHLESFSDYSNRLPRGRSYVRNGSVCHLEIAQSKISAVVSGSRPYDVSIAIAPLAAEKWSKLKEQCAGHIASLIELLQGKFSSNVMKTVTDTQQGLFPLPSEIKLRCSCPDSASMCKHVAAVLYGVGSRLDSAPELLFLLRAVNHAELIQIDARLAVENGSGKNTRSKRIADDSIADLFGIDMLDGSEATSNVNAISSIEPNAKIEKVVGTKTRGGTKGSDTNGSDTNGSDTKGSDTNGSDTKSSGTNSGTKNSRIEDIGTDRSGISSSGNGTLTPVAIKTAKSVKAKGTKFTGTRLNGLRQKFEMSQVQFAKILGVSPSSIGKWEKDFAILNLRADTLAVLQYISKLSKKRVWELLE